MEQKFQISLVCDQQVSSYWSSLVATPQILKSKSNWKSISGVPPSCYSCCPNSPLDRVNQSTDSSHRDVIPFIDQRIPYCARVARGFRRILTLLSSSSHMCSIGVKSGLYGGHASGAMLLFGRKSWQTRATCGRALSCCRIRLRCCTSGTATGRKISSLYLTAVILPATINNCDFYPVSNASPDHNGATPKPIPFDNTGVGKAFSATSVHTTSTICAIESEPRLVRKKNSSPLPHRK